MKQKKINLQLTEAEFALLTLMMQDPNPFLRIQDPNPHLRESISWADWDSNERDSFLLSQRIIATYREFEEGKQEQPLPFTIET